MKTSGIYTIGILIGFLGLGGAKIPDETRLMNDVEKNFGPIIQNSQYETCQLGQAGILERTVDEKDGRHLFKVHVKVHCPEEHKREYPTDTFEILFVYEYVISLEEYGGPYWELASIAPLAYRPFKICPYILFPAVVIFF